MTTRINGSDGVPGGKKYTPITVKDKDSGNSFVINFANAKIEGNENSWTIKDGKLYDKNGKTIQDNILEVTRYQAALIKAAAQGDDYNKDNYLNEYDLNGAAYADAAKAELQKAKSEYKLDKWDTGEVPDEKGGWKTEYVDAADAYEHGVIEADVVNNKGEKGHLKISLLKDAPPPQAKKESNFEWYNPLTWF